MWTCPPPVAASGLLHQSLGNAVLDTGDITDWGSQPENRLITRVGTYDVPYVYIRGNHDSAATAALPRPRVPPAARRVVEMENRALHH